MLMARSTIVEPRHMLMARSTIMEPRHMLMVNRLGVAVGERCACSRQP